MKNIPFVDLKQQNRAIRSQIDRVWKRVTRHTGYILGGEVQTFERNFARYVGSRYAVGTSSGTDALVLALRSLDLKPTDEVVVPANSYISTALAVWAAGAQVVFADVDPDTLLLDAPNIHKVLSRRTRAVIPVHLFGQPADMPPILSLARQRGLYVVEDSAQAHGAAIGRKRCGQFGDLGAFSFYPGKNLGAFGDGGAIVTSSRRSYQRMLAFRNMGAVQRFQHSVKGLNQRLDALQAAILGVKLKHLDAWNLQRNRLAAEYDRLLDDLPELKRIARRKRMTCVYHLYVVRSAKRDKLMNFLNLNGVSTGLHYPVPIHLQKAYASEGYRRGDLPVAERASREGLSLPMYPELGLSQVRRVSRLIHQFFE